MRRGFVVTAFGAALATWLSVGVASAAPFGTLTTTSCSGQGVTVYANSIDWLPAGTGYGCIETDQPTDITYAGGTLAENVTGLIKDLLAPAPPPTVVDFMTFPGYDLSFDLTSIGPGAPNTVCPDAFVGADCSFFDGSPFILHPSGVGTTVYLIVHGIARDASGESPWVGLFNVPFVGETPFQLATRFNTDGQISSGHAGNFQVTAVPEPASLMLLGTGLIGAAVRARKGLRRREK